MSKKVTLNDIALETNLSKYAVSRAISGKPGISEETRDRVLKASKKLGYVKSASRSAKTNDKYILLLIPENDLNDATFWMRVLQGTESAAAEKGYALRVKVIKENEDALLAAEVAKASGILYAGHKSVGYARAFAKNGCPGLLMSYPPESLFEMDVIHTGDCEAGFALCRQLIQWGHTRIAFYGATRRPSTLNRLKGVREALQKSDLELSYLWNDEKYLRQDVMTRELTLLRKEDKMPTAILCSYESLAQSMVFALSALQLSIPDDVSIMVFNLDLHDKSPIPFSGVGLGKQDYGRLALNCLCDRIKNPSLPFRRTTVLPSLCLKGTASPVKNKRNRHEEESV